MKRKDKLGGVLVHFHGHDGRIDGVLARKTTYADGSLCLVGYQGVEPYAIFSVNIVSLAYKLNPGEIFFKTYSENAGMLEQLQTDGVVGPELFKVSTGWVSVPAVKVLI